MNKGCKLSNLNHISVDLPSGGEVIVLDTGAIIDAEAEAMLQALHSRSTGGLKRHLEILAEKGPENFMKNFYVGYGHKSIGDCGSTTVFVEGVSMLVAKAIQDNPLYSGQEASTRYVDFSNQLFINPSKISEIDRLLELQRDFYLNSQKPTREILKKLHPRQNEEANKLYEKAINARAFDITRSLLPAGAATNLAWHTNLRQAADKMLFLRHHPLEEVREVANGIEEALKVKYPNSFGHKKYFATESYQELIAESYYYHDPESPEKVIVDLSKINRKGIEEYRELFEKRPEKTDLPKYLGQIGSVDIQFKLDFGSFRDIQRHRAINQRMPLLTTQLGFNDWYTTNFHERVLERLPEHLSKINETIDRLDISPEQAQYYIPMGYNASNKFTGDLPGTIYMVELRANSAVHPTLQKVAYSIADHLSSQLNIPIYTGTEPGRFDIKRGKQDIVLKNDP